MLLNLQQEISSILNSNAEEPPKSELACTDIMTAWNQQIRFGHNEDAVAAIKDYAFIATFQPNDPEGR